jgi:dienelactone hydrolase
MWNLLRASPLPRPTGPHAVGTTVVGVRGPRDLPVQVWYPARRGGGRPAALLAARGVGGAVAATYPVPAALAEALRLVRGHAIADAPPAPTAPAGVVVLAHGWMGFRSIHADLAEQLASEGWVVLAADHVGIALVTQHLDGTVAPLQPELKPPEAHPEYRARTLALIERYGADLEAVVAAVAAGRAGPRVPATDRVLLVGQSTGGGAAIRTAARDDRVVGVVGLDPWVEPVRAADRAAVAQPVVAVRSGGWIGNRNDALLRAMPTVELRSVPEAIHTDLTCLGYLGRLTRLAGLTRCDPQLVHDAALAAVADVAAAVAAAR